MIASSLSQAPAVQAPCAGGQQTRRGVACFALNRRSMIYQGAGMAASAALLSAMKPGFALAAGEPQAKGPITSSLVNEEIAQKIESGELPRKKGPNGLEYVDVVEGTGASPAVGFQVVASYVAMTVDGRAFDDSIEKKQLYDFRIGSDTVVAGLDQGIRTMKSGGIRRIYIPGELGFPKGLPGAPGRPRIPPNSPIIFDVKLILVPGLDD